MKSMEFERFIASWYAGTYKYLIGNLLQQLVVVSLHSISNLLLYEPKEIIQADIFTVPQEYSLIHESLCRLYIKIWILYWGWSNVSIRNSHWHHNFESDVRPIEGELVAETNSKFNIILWCQWNIQSYSKTSTNVDF